MSVHSYLIEYEFKKESITVSYNNQYICFHNFYAKNKSPFRRFTRDVKELMPQDINDIFELAKLYDIRSQSRVRETEEHFG